MNKREFIKLLKANGACEPAIKWCKSQKNLDTIFRCDNYQWWAWLVTRLPQFKTEFELYHFTMAC